MPTGLHIDDIGTFGQWARATVALAFLLAIVEIAGGSKWLAALGLFLVLVHAAVTGILALRTYTR